MGKIIAFPARPAQETEWQRQVRIVAGEQAILHQLMGLVAKLERRAAVEGVVTRPFVWPARPAPIKRPKPKN